MSQTEQERIDGLCNESGLLYEDSVNYIQDTNAVYHKYLTRRMLANEETDPVKRQEELDKAKKLFYSELKKLDRQ